MVQAGISTALRLKTEMDKRMTLARELQELNKDLERRVSEKVAELRLAHEELKASEGKNRSIFENTVEGIHQSALDGRFLSASPSMARMLGYDSPGELISSAAHIGGQWRIHPDDRKSLMHTLTRDGVITGSETRIKKRTAKSSGALSQPASFVTIRGRSFKI